MPIDWGFKIQHVTCEQRILGAFQKARGISSQIMILNNIFRLIAAINRIIGSMATLGIN